MQIRRATQEDLERCAAILTHWILHSCATFDDQPFTLERAQPWFDAHQTDVHPLLVAAEDEVLGWGTLTPWSPKGGYARTAEVSVFVAQECLGLGVGKRLLEKLVEWATGVNHRVLLARIEATNQPSLRAFEQAGFERVGTMHNVGCKFDRWLDIALLERQLG